MGKVRSSHSSGNHRPSVVMFVTNDVRTDGRVRKEALSLDAAGYSVTVIGLGRRTEVEEEERVGGVRIKRIFLRTRRWRGAIAAVGKYVEYHARCMVAAWRLRGDIFHAHDLPTLPIAWTAAVLSNGRLVYDSHELYFDRPGFRLKAMWGRFQALLMRRANLIIAANEDRARIMWEEYGAPHFPLVIHNYPERGGRQYSTQLRDWLRARNMHWDVVILHQGKISQDRAPDVVIKSLSAVPRSAGVVFVGRIAEAYRRELEELAVRLKVADRVAFHPEVPQQSLSAYTASADIGLALYRNVGRNNYYCAPNKVYDYARAGVAIIVSDFPGMRRELVERGAAVGVNPESSDDLAAALNSLVSNKAARTAVVARAMSLAEAEWNWQEEEKALLGAYATLT